MNNGMKTISADEKRLLGLIQAAFPLIEEPFAVLATTLNMTEADVIESIKSLKDRGIVRQIGPVINPPSLGYRTTLVAMKLDPERMAMAEEAIHGHPGISHAYEREHEFNLWVTLAVGPGVDIDENATKFGQACGADITVSLPSVKTFKLKALFGEQLQDETSSGPSSGSNIALTVIQKQVVNCLQQDLDLNPRPWDKMAVESGMGTTQFLSIVSELMDMGVVRRYGANINHRKAGYTANAMTCWKVGKQDEDAMGAILALLPEVSHCYTRRLNPEWPYNLFAMIHAGTREQCFEIANRVSVERGNPDFTQLFSTREIKKLRNVYQA